MNNWKIFNENITIYKLVSVWCKVDAWVCCMMRTVSVVENCEELDSIPFKDNADIEFQVIDLQAIIHLICWISTDSIWGIWCLGLSCSKAGVLTRTTTATLKRNPASWFVSCLASFQSSRFQLCFVSNFKVMSLYCGCFQIKLNKIFNWEPTPYLNESQVAK